ncbi:MAG TPA: cell division protein SepF [Candidatus Pullilachnospira intestinigallinarum]|nr:cell division protein SepF [Candidatus Pullilachnospira intestinigallinarum]
MSVLDKFLDAIRLNDDFDDDDEFFDDDELEAMDEEKPKHRFFKKLEDDYDDEDEEEPAPPKKVKTAKAAAAASSPKPARQQKSAASSSKITPMRGRKVTGGNMEVCVIKPSSMEDTRDIADTLIDRCTVVLNLEGIDVDVAQRIIDFSSGACYSIGGSLQKVSSYIFILTPANVEITGDFQEILSGAFDVPSVRTGF